MGGWAVPEDGVAHTQGREVADPCASFVRLASARSFGVPQVAAVSFIKQPADLAPIVDLLSFSPKAESRQTERFLWLRLLNLLPQTGLN